jgi:hypothetical protein
LSPKKEREVRNPFAPKKDNIKNSTKPKKTYEVDRWDGGGGSIYHSKTSTSVSSSIDTTVLTSKKRIEGIKRDLKGSERERELRKLLKPFTPFKPVSSVTETALEDAKDATGENEINKLLRSFDAEDDEPKNEEAQFEEKFQVSVDESENLENNSAAFTAKRVRQIGFDPRRKVNEEVKLGEKKILPIIGGQQQRISLDGVLGGENNKNQQKDEMDSDSDSDLDIVMAVC